MKTREDYEAAGFLDMARDRSYYLSTCPHANGTWQRDAWQAGAWRWMQSQRTKNTRAAIRGERKAT